MCPVDFDLLILICFEGLYKVLCFMSRLCAMSGCGEW